MITSLPTSNQSRVFKLLKKLNIQIGTKIKVIEKLEFDNSLEIIIDNKKLLISKKIASNIKITKI